MAAHLGACVLEGFCRTLQRGLQSGLDVPRVFRMEGKRHSGRLNDACENMAVMMEQGAAIHEAFEAQGPLFPPLFLAMIKVGEETGNLPEVLLEMGRHYSEIYKLQRKLQSQLTMPIFQLLMAFFIITVLILVLGFMPKNPGQPSFDPLGFGLSGVSGAVVFLTIIGLLAFGGFMLWKTVLSQLWFQRRVSAMFISLPLVGDYFRESALARFSLGLGMTMDSSISVRKALRISMNATSNDAFIENCESVLASVKKGNPMTVSLGKCNWFPEEYLAQVEIGEESGTIPEVCRRLATIHFEQAGRHLATLFYLLGGAVWLCTVFFIVFMIMRMYGGYINALSI